MLPRLLVVGLLCLGCVMADVYLHNMRGSNNRLNEKSANRKNANRMFDSQVIKVFNSLILRFRKICIV